MGKNIPLKKDHFLVGPWNILTHLGEGLVPYQYEYPEESWGEHGEVTFGCLHVISLSQNRDQSRRFFWPFYF